MKNLFFIVCLLTLTSCASIFNGSKAKVVLGRGNITEPVDITVEGKVYRNVGLPCKVKIKRGYKDTKVITTAEGYETSTLLIHKKFNGLSIVNLSNLLGWGIDAATGAITKPEFKHYDLYLNKKQTYQPNYVEAPIVNTEEPTGQVSRDNPGQTALERTVLRWYFDSEPRGARIYWRVISSIPHIVKNTNETYLMTTPFEETRSFNILGLTYENSRDIVIEIKLSKKGYEDQVKRFNVRQAIDQQEISSFFELVKKEE